VAYPGTTFLAAEKWLNLIVTSINSFAGELSQNSSTLRVKSQLPNLSGFRKRERLHARDCQSLKTFERDCLVLDHFCSSS
jgi:hypothetical protein